MACRKSLAVLLVLCIAGCVERGSGQDEAAAKSAFHAADSALASHSTGFSLDDDPQAPALLEREWSVLRQWSVDYLDRHPGANEQDLVSAIGGLDRNLSVEALRLDPRSYLVAAGRDEIGTVFIVTAAADRFAVAWSIADPAASRQQGMDMLAAWSTDKARESCRREPSENWRDCGPVHARLGRLPDQRDGTRRFYVDGTYAQAAGATVGAQLSIWEWSGRSAEPLYTILYGYMADQPVGTRVDGDLLMIRAKEEFHSFFACGSCEGRQIDLIIRIDPDGIADLGKVSTMPELDLIDMFFDRIIAGKSAADIASPAAVTVAAAKVAGIRREDADLKDDLPALGMLMGWKATTAGQRTRVCIATDAGGTFLFTIEAVDGKGRIATVADLGDAWCGD